MTILILLKCVCYIKIRQYGRLKEYQFYENIDKILPFHFLSNVASTWKSKIKSKNQKTLTHTFTFTPIFSINTLLIMLSLKIETLYRHIMIMILIFMKKVLNLLSINQCEIEDILFMIT